MKPKSLHTNQPHEIVIEIAEDGTFDATVLGITGTACEGISAFLDELGAVVEHKHTVDFYRDPEQKVTIKK
jgi:putative protein kinase ArgK-like GTPase of G3E family